jgi:(p)ppGpp synthase/HD superfamily hydrolase
MIRVLPSPEFTLSPDFAEALSYAAQLHKEQTRKGGTIPYISHLISVAGIVLEYGGSEDEAIAALLHDAVEDQGGLPTLERIRRRFGGTVAEIVEGCTDADVIPKPPWRARKEAYLAHLPSASESVQFVSAADKLHNATAILRDYLQDGEEVWKRFKGGKEGTLWYYRSLVEAYKSLCTKSVGATGSVKHTGKSRFHVFTPMIRTSNNSPALVALLQALVLGHVIVEPGEGMKAAPALRAVILGFVLFIFIA